MYVTTYMGIYNLFYPTTGHENLKLPYIRMYSVVVYTHFHPLALVVLVFHEITREYT